MVFLRSGYRGLEGHLGTSLEVDLEGHLEGHLRSILRPYLDPFWTLIKKPHQKPQNCLCLAVGRALRLNMTNIWVLGWFWVGTGIVPLPTHPVPIPRVHPPYPGYTAGHASTGTRAVPAGQIVPWGSYPSANSL